MAGRISSPAFVGRAGELTQGSAALARAAERQPAVLLVSGEAGVGKTRLLHEIATDARRRGFRILEGGCVQLGSDGLPFGPVIEALRGLSDELSPAQLDQVLGTSRAALMSVMPGMESSSNRPSSVETSQGTLFEHIFLVLRRLARLAPVALLVEDVHWADRTTLEFLVFVVRNLRDDPIALIGTYRSDELHRRHPLRPILAELERSGRAERLALQPFDRREVAAQVQGILGAEPDPELVDSVYARSDGNAFLAEELVAVGGGLGLPENLQDLVLVRVGVLGDATQELLRTASVAGSRFDLAQLAAVASLPHGGLFEAVREAIDAHILVPFGEADGDQFAFRHALLQEAIYMELLPSQRIPLHEAYARDLELNGRGDDAAGAAALAYHWAAARNFGRAFEASVRAGLAADAIYAVADARVNYERALELWDSVPDAEARSPLDRIDLLTRAATAAARTSRTKATGHLRAAIDLADRAGLPLRAGFLRAFLAALFWIWDDLVALDQLREAIAMIPTDPPSAERARALGQLGALLVTVERCSEGLLVLEEALAVMHAVGTPPFPVGTLATLGLDLTVPRRVESVALEQQGLALAALGDLETGLDRIGQSRAIANELQIASRINEGWIAESLVLTRAGMFEEALQRGLAGADEATAQGLAGMQGAINLFFAAQPLVALGRWNEAAQLIEQSLRQADDIGLMAVLDCVVAPFEVARGDFAMAERRLARQRGYARRVRWPFPITAHFAADAALALWRNDPGAAATSIREVLPSLDVATDIWVGHLGPLYALGLWAEADLAALGRRQESEGTARAAIDTGRELLGRMRAYAEDTAARRPLYTPQAAAWLASCEAEFGRAEGRSDPDAWAAAAAAWDRIRMPYPRAYALLREGQAVLAGRGDRARAADAIRQGSSIAAELGARPLAERFEDLAGRLGVRPEPDRVTQPGAPRHPGRYELTRRELEILDLLAGGRTDGEIAADLFISKKTVSVHINNIKGKLGADSRVGIIRSAAGLGLIRLETRS
jgi:DNA-binding CsgD family transcriptional regulator